MSNKYLDKNKYSEEDLITVAQFDDCDKEANKAMRALRTNICDSYFFCIDCDRLVTKEAYCCLNMDYKEDNVNNLDW